jgi:hypothetical protein
VSKRKPRSSPSVIDVLEAKGILDTWLAKDLRQIEREYDSKPEPLVGDDVKTLESLFVALTNPWQRRVREAQFRQMIMAGEHAYFKARGETAAISRTAGNFGVTPKTVHNAVQEYPNIRFKNPLSAQSQRMRPVMIGIRESLVQKSTKKSKRAARRK